MGWNDRMDISITCDECEHCVDDCTDHEALELCYICGKYPCMCDEMYEDWKQSREE
jgi:hypothetical protein